MVALDERRLLPDTQDKTDERRIRSLMKIAEGVDNMATPYPPQGPAGPAQPNGPGPVPPATPNGPEDG